MGPSVFTTVKFREQQLKNPVHICQHILVSYSHHFNASSSQLCIPCSICLDDVGIAVNLHRQIFLGAAEVCNIWTKDRLTPEFMTA